MRLTWSNRWAEISNFVDSWCKNWHGGVEVLQGRAEECWRLPEPREQYDWAVPGQLPI